MGNVTFASEEYIRLKQEVSRKSSMANKRLVRLENNNLTNLPAYKQWKDYKGGIKFSVKGKSYNELQKEMARLDSFLNKKTSLVRQANNVLKDIAENTGIKYNSVKELQVKSQRFFELASKIEQYLRNVEGSASALGYQKIWDSVNQYVKESRVDLSSADFDMDKALERIKELVSYENVEQGWEGYGSGGKIVEWFDGLRW